MSTHSEIRLDPTSRKERDVRRTTTGKGIAQDPVAPRSNTHRFQKPEEYSDRRPRSRSSSPNRDYKYTYTGEYDARKEYDEEVQINTRHTSSSVYESRDERHSSKETRTTAPDHYVTYDPSGWRSSSVEYPPPRYSNPIFPHDTPASRHSAQPLQTQQETEQYPRHSNSNVSRHDRHGPISTQGGEYNDLSRKESQTQTGQVNALEESLRKDLSINTGRAQRATRLSSTLAWTAKSFAGQGADIYVRLSQTDNLSIAKALKGFKAGKFPRGLASPQTFNLGAHLRGALASIADEVYSGCGFKVLDGLDLRSYSEEDRVILFAGLTRHVADIRANYIDHVRNKPGRKPKAGKLIPPFREIEMKFHTDIDVHDMLALFTLSVADRGGNQYLASMESIHHLLQAEDPRALLTLKEDWYWERVYRSGDKEIRKVMRRPLVALDDQGRVQINYSGAMVGANPDYPLSRDAPGLSKAQSHALKQLNDVARRVCISLVPKAGQILFVNNYALLHARDSYTDSATHQRHLIRSWLHDTTKGWTSAPELKRQNDIFDLAPKNHLILTSAEWEDLAQQGIKFPSILKYCHD